MAKILVIEDNAELSHFFSLLLTMKGHAVATANCRREMQCKLDIFQPDLIIMDVWLGKEDGRDICKEIKATIKQIKIILLSANPRLLDDYQLCEADLAIEKPFELNHVLETINKLLSKIDVNLVTP